MLAHQPTTTASPIGQRTIHHAARGSRPLYSSGCSDLVCPREAIRWWLERETAAALLVMDLAV